MESTRATSTQRESLIEACSKGDTLKVQEILQTSGPSQKPSSQPGASLEPILTTALLAKAIEHNHPDTVHFILTILPAWTKIPEESIRWALLSPLVHMYKLLFTYDPSIIHTSIFEGRETQLGKALSISATPERIESLLSCGLKPSTDPFSMSELGLACGRWQMQPIALCTLLLAHGASLLHSGALAAAAKTGRMQVVRWLLEKGVDVNDAVTNVALVEHPCRGHPWPALHAAVGKGYVDVVKLLLERGADPGLLDGNGKTAFAVAEEGEKNGETIALLKSSGTARAMDGGAI